MWDFHPFESYGTGGRSTWVHIYSSAWDLISDILLTRGRCASWEIQVFPGPFSRGGRVKKTPHFLRVGDWTKKNSANIESSSLHLGFVLVSDVLLLFGTIAPQMLDFGQILHFLTPSSVKKIGEGWKNTWIKRSIIGEPLDVLGSHSKSEFSGVGTPSSISWYLASPHYTAANHANVICVNLTRNSSNACETSCKPTALQDIGEINIHGWILGHVVWYKNIKDGSCTCKIAKIITLPTQTQALINYINLYIAKL